MQGTPREIFSRPDEIKKHKLDLPQVTELADELAKEGVDMPKGILSIDEFVEAFTSRYAGK